MPQPLLSRVRLMLGLAADQHLLDAPIVMGIRRADRRLDGQERGESAHCVLEPPQRVDAVHGVAVLDRDAKPDVAWNAAPAIAGLDEAPCARRAAW